MPLLETHHKHECLDTSAGTAIASVRHIIARDCHTVTTYQPFYSAIFNSLDINLRSPDPTAVLLLRLHAHPALP
jgi:hypothetical protein